MILSDILEKTIKKLCINRGDWELVKFGDVAIQQKKSVDRDTTDITKYVKGEHMYSEDLHLREWGELEDEYLGPAFIRLFDEGDILYGSRRTYLRKVTIAPFEGITSNTTFVMKANEKKINKRLLPFVMLSEGFAGHSIKNSKGSVNPYVNWKDLADYEFLLPPKEQQAELAELLWAMDEVIEKDLEVLEKQQVFVTSTRINAFENNNWQQGKLKDCFDVQLGKMLSQKSTTGVNSFPYLANQNVQWGKIQFEKLNVMDFNDREREKFKLENGDLLVCEGGEVGRAAIWKDDIENCYYQKALHRLRVKNNSYLPEVMLEFMFWAATKGMFKGQTGHSTIAHLTAGTLKEIPVPKIPIAEQKKLKTIFIELKSLVSITNSKISASKALQKSLINEIF